ncbi:MAG TPA: GNAT family N-acetyltransferase [Thermomicrobiales bacterium]|jgi:GNAT superfamily N-acetyltransferase
MSTILTDMTTSRIIDAIEANLSAYYLPYGTLPGGIVHTEPDVTWFVSGIPEPWFNGVVGAKLVHAPQQHAAAILADLTAHNFPFLWHIGPTATRGNLDMLLHDQGLRPFADEPCMALNLQEMPELPAPPAGFVAAPVHDAEALTRWTDVWMATVPEPTRQHCRAVYARLGVSATAPWRYYLGLFDGVPVVTAKLFYAQGVVSVQHVMTLPTARRRGIGAALVSQALQQARLRGYRLAVLTATPDSYALYRRLGFRDYGRWVSYIWRPSRDAVELRQTAFTTD